jgi:hypothetical protein
MTEDKKASTLVKAIIDYIYEEAEGKLSNAEILGVIEFVKIAIVQDMMEVE